MKILLLTENFEFHSCQRLQEECQALGILVTCQNPYEESSLSFTPDKVKQGHGDIILHRSTGTRWDDFDLLYSLEAKAQGWRVYNDPQSMIYLRSKDWQTHLWQKAQIPVVPSYTFRGHPTTKNLEQIGELFAAYLQPGQEQFILKANRGNQGLGISLINGWDSLLGLLETFWAIKDQKFMIQPFLRTKSEYRFFLCREKIFSVLKRTPGTNDFRANAQHGEAQILNPHDSPALCALALRALKTSGLFYGAVDILEWKNKYFILELNPVPGFKQLEELSGQNVARHLLQEILDDYASHR
ncbi:MAG: hypothetical protein WCG27_03895 [Pseudomonadota bacterium]